MTTSTGPDYQPYMHGAFRWRLAIRPLDLHDWIQVGDDYDHEMDGKQRVLRDHRDTVVSLRDDIVDDAAEVLAAIVEHVPSRFPQLFTRDGDHIEIPHRNERHRITPSADGTWHEHPLVVASRLVQEDLALLVERDGRLVFGGGVVCFPNRWDLSSKLNLSMAEVHAPVSQLNEQLEAPIDSFFDRLSPEKSFWRLGWGVLDTDDPYQPMDGSAAESPAIPEIGDPSTGDRLFLRVERETLRRLPTTRCVLFTIRTYIRPLSHLVDRPADAARLAEALSNLPDDVRDYKRTLELTDAAVAWLQSVSS